MQEQSYGTDLNGMLNHQYQTNLNVRSTHQSLDLMGHEMQQN